ncbi:MAG: response regulator transcription factor [Acidobacteriaceae bacterium]|nr:response regulator transcription factor [Acidobacteriaceae bacterium]
MPDKPTVVIAEDNVLILEGSLRPLLEREFEIVATAEDGRAAISAAAQHKPAVMLIDVSLPLVRGFEAARQILAACPETKILFVSNYADRAYVDQAFHMGASGYVLKSRIVRELVAAIRKALAGEFYRPET